jgi:hypothetical protein
MTSINFQKMFKITLPYSTVHQRNFSRHFRNSAMLRTTESIAEKMLRNCKCGPSKFDFRNSAAFSYWYCQSAFLHVSLSVCPPIYVSVRLSVRLSDCPPICLYVCLLSVCLPACLSACLCLSVGFPVCLSGCLSVCLPVCLPAYLSVCLLVCLLFCRLPVSVRLPASLSVYLSACLSVSVWKTINVYN